MSFIVKLLSEVLPFCVNCWLDTSTDHERIVWNQINGVKSMCHPYFQRSNSEVKCCMQNKCLESKAMNIHIFLLSLFFLIFLSIDLIIYLLLTCLWCAAVYPFSMLISCCGLCLWHFLVILSCFLGNWQIVLCVTNTLPDSPPTI